MDSKRHLYINKYFAFAFMVFAVLSSVSDNYNEVNVTSAKSRDLAYFLNINHLLVQNSGRITAQSFESKCNAFSKYVQGIIATDAATKIYNVAASGILFFALIYLNNKIAQNNIWRKAVF